MLDALAAMKVQDARPSACSAMVPGARYEATAECDVHDRTMPLPLFVTPPSISIERAEPPG
jgi:hypothetical protein